MLITACESASRASPRSPARRARAEFHAALQPADDLAVGNVSGDAIAEDFFVRNVFVRGAVSFQEIAKSRRR